VNRCTCFFANKLYLHNHHPSSIHNLHHHHPSHQLTLHHISHTNRPNGPYEINEQYYKGKATGIHSKNGPPSRRGNDRLLHSALSLPPHPDDHGARRLRPVRRGPEQSEQGAQVQRWEMGLSSLFLLPIPLPLLVRIRNADAPRDRSTQKSPRH